MYLYNVTVNVEKELEPEWMTWMKEVHIPDVLATGMFHENKIFRILHDSEDGSINYSIQYFTDSMEKVLEYQSKYAPKLQQDVRDKYQDRIVTFRTLLQMV